MLHDVNIQIDRYLSSANNDFNYLCHSLMLKRSEHASLIKWYTNNIYVYKNEYKKLCTLTDMHVKLGCTDADISTRLCLMSHISAVGQAHNWFNYWLGAEPLITRITVIEYCRTNNLKCLSWKRIWSAIYFYPLVTWHSLAVCHWSNSGEHGQIIPIDFLANLTKTVNIIIHCVSWLQVRCRMWRGLQTHPCM